MDKDKEMQKHCVEIMKGLTALLFIWQCNKFFQLVLGPFAYS